MLWHTYCPTLIDSPYLNHRRNHRRRARRSRSQDRRQATRSRSQGISPTFIYSLYLNHRRVFMISLRLKMGTYLRVLLFLGLLSLSSCLNLLPLKERPLVRETVKRMRISSKIFQFFLLYHKGKSHYLRLRPF
jgi:hypothetical protein